MEYILNSYVKIQDSQEFEYFLEIAEKEGLYKEDIWVMIRNSFPNYALYFNVFTKNYKTPTDSVAESNDINFYNLFNFVHNYNVYNLNEGDYVKIVNPYSCSYTDCPHKSLIGKIFQVDILDDYRALLCSVEGEKVYHDINYSYLQKVDIKETSSNISFNMFENNLIYTNENGEVKEISMSNLLTDSNGENLFPKEEKSFKWWDNGNRKFDDKSKFHLANICDSSKKEVFLEKKQVNKFNLK